MGRLIFALVLHLPDIATRSSSELRDALQGSSPIAGKVHGRTCEKYVQRFDSRLPSGPSPSVSSTPLTLRSTVIIAQELHVEDAVETSAFLVVLVRPGGLEASPEHGQALSSRLRWKTLVSVLDFCFC